MSLIKEQNTLYYYSYNQLVEMIKGNYISFTREGLKRRFRVVRKGKNFIGLKSEIGQLYKITQRKEPRTNRKVIKCGICGNTAIFFVQEFAFCRDHMNQGNV